MLSFSSFTSRAVAGLLRLQIKCFGGNYTGNCVIDCLSPRSRGWHGIPDAKKGGSAYYPLYCTTLYFTALYCSLQNSLDSVTPVCQLGSKRISIPNHGVPRV